MSNTAAVDTVQATGAILAAYAGNPTPSITPERLLSLIDEVHSKLSGFSGAPAAQVSGQVMSATAQSSLSGSEVFLEQHDPAKIWPDATDEQRQKFLRLIEEHNLQLDANGIPTPRRARHLLVEPDLVYDPISGEGFKMLRRHLAVTYNLDENELRAFFKLDDNYVITAPNYSASKAKQAAIQGLGRGNKKSAAADQSRKAAAAKPKSVKPGKAPTARKAGKAKTTAKAAGKAGAARTTVAA